jgi:hypothetical protein
MPPTNTEQMETSVMSITQIPEIQRKKSEQLNEIIEKVAKLKSTQVLVLKVKRTKKNALNRQFPIKVGTQLGETYTVVSRMGVEQYKQDVNELYVYIYKTPPPSETDTAATSNTTA